MLPAFDLLTKFAHSTTSPLAFHDSVHPHTHKHLRIFPIVGLESKLHKNLSGKNHPALSTPTVLPSGNNHPALSTPTGKNHPALSTLPNHIRSPFLLFQKLPTS